MAHFMLAQHRILSNEFGNIKTKLIPHSFTAQYNVHMLIYYEIHSTYLEAARREARFKNWCRKWKLNLIEEFNPTWRDLYGEICS